jgi:NAD(P)-dependent dehydrogenase (short-subunit alcohol dehydrogenase family)
MAAARQESADRTRRFEGKVALVTGAAKGIGRAAALGLAQEGALVGALGRSPAGLEEVVAEIRSAGGEAVAMPADVGVAAEVEADAERSEMSRDDYLAAQARIAPLGRLIEAEEVASVVLYLLSDDAAAATGSIHAVDGGWLSQINVGDVA